jgi:hypothetical protein
VIFSLVKVLVNILKPLCYFSAVGNKMPFKSGVSPIRRTLKYLEAGPIVFKERVRVMTVNFNEPVAKFTTKKEFPHHKGAKEFVFWTLPQIQYKNPHIQVASFKNMTPSPFISCYLENGEKVKTRIFFGIFWLQICHFFVTRIKMQKLS